MEEDAAKENGSFKPVGSLHFQIGGGSNTVEFSYDQGVYEQAREIWGGMSAAD